MEKLTMIWGTEAVKGIEKPEEGYTKKTYAFNSIERGGNIWEDIIMAT